jgi:hypothetical protein
MQIVSNPDVYERIDEFFFEHHVNFAPMLKLGWADTYNKNKTLFDSYKLFSDLRFKGIRAHGWP